MESAYDARIKSRPLYSPIVIRENAAFHLFISEESVENRTSDLFRLFNECQSQVKHWLGLSVEDVFVYSQNVSPITAESEALSRVLSTLPLASQTYVSGSESFMWDIHNLLIAAGLLTEQVSLMAPTSSVRRVFCTHCYTVMQKVEHTPVTCQGCQRPLLVRDHFSRVHGAYVGLNVNAEDVNDIPEKEALT